MNAITNHHIIQLNSVGTDTISVAAFNVKRGRGSGDRLQDRQNQGTSEPLRELLGTHYKGNTLDIIYTSMIVLYLYIAVNTQQIYL